MLFLFWQIGINSFFALEHCFQKPTLLNPARDLGFGFGAILIKDNAAEITIVFKHCRVTKLMNATEMVMSPSGQLWVEERLIMCKERGRI